MRAKRSPTSHRMKSEERGWACYMKLRPSLSAEPWMAKSIQLYVLKFKLIPCFQ